MSNARKIGVSLPPDVYEWVTQEVAQGRADSVSALIAKGLNAMRGRAEIEALVADLRAEIGELTDEDRARIDAAHAAAKEARRRFLEGKYGNVGHVA